jgi:hypothetical protein
VFHSNKPEIANFRADYAKHADFCDVFKNDTKPLYLLAFLLTANHKESERCFISTVEEVFKEQAVFKEWARSWVRKRPETGSLERRATRETRIRNRYRDQTGPIRALRFCHVAPGALFELGVLYVTGMQREQSSASADESLAPASGTRTTPFARQWSAIAPSRSHGVTIGRRTAKGDRPLSPIAKLLSLLHGGGACANRHTPWRELRILVMHPLLLCPLACGTLNAEEHLNSDWAKATREVPENSNERGKATGNSNVLWRVTA